MAVSLADSATATKKSIVGERWGCGPDIQTFAHWPQPFFFSCHALFAPYLAEFIESIADSLIKGHKRDCSR
ncbi:hypothetical protein HY409_04030 [Candidatus Gottesmanbacteria bacterium]|nr:hypothetical protein [Candidatus Gottesmanbacteria bacterium]